MNPGPIDWGTRLGERMRAALRAGDAASARCLALEGDGRARDLAREFGLMAHGLGFTIRVLLGQLIEADREGERQAQAIWPGPPAGDSLTGILARLLQGLQGGAARAGVSAPGTPAALAQACLAALAQAQQRFAADQTRRADEILGALADGRLDAAIAMLDAKDQAWLALHDPMVRFMADSFGWVLREFGDQALVDFHLATAEAQRAGFEKWERMPAREFAATTAFLLGQHMGEVRVEEDELRFTIRQSPCGSGGRLRLAGAYDGGQALPFVETPGPLTFGEPRMPVYCTHCAIWNGSATLRWFGRAQWVFERPARADGACTLHIYKRPEDAPAQYARRLALPEGRETS